MKEVNEFRLDSVFSEKLIKPLLLSFKKNSERNAFCIDGCFYTYYQFSCRVRAIQLELSGLNEENIGLVANNDLDTYASIIALWFQGKSYVPLHPEQPVGRCLDIIAQVGIRTILDSSQESRYSDQNIISTSRLNNIELETSAQILKYSDSQLAYILFTSGTTGRPKGVPITRGNVASFVQAVDKLGIKLNDKDRCLQMFDLTFDLSVQSYLLPLLAGSCIYTVPSTSIKYQVVFELFDEYHLTFALMVPSVIHYLRPYMDEINNEEMRYSLFCGEALNLEDVEPWKKCIPRAELWNMYGPTECTIYCTAYRIGITNEEKQVNGNICIGKSMEGVKTTIIGEGDNVCNANEKGELCLAGDQLTPGYWKNDENNRKAFFVSKDGVRYYRTGDICTRDESGDILYYGRKDSQVKIQGYRVELSEIENTARGFFTENKAVVAVPINNKETDLCQQIYLVVEGEDNRSGMDLADYMKTLLPVYMLPNKIYFLKRFPQNSNNKIDRNKIAEMIK